MRWPFLFIVWMTGCGLPGPLAGQSPQEFFESRIRPVLIEHCYQCHNSTDAAEGDLAVDWREGIRSASANGIAVVPGEPGDSLLLKVLRHEITGLEMPAGGPQLPATVIADFEKWIVEGAFDPRTRQPGRAELSEALAWETRFARRRQWWSWQPLAKPELPPANGWSDHPIDRFVFQSLTGAGLPPAPPASRRDLIRRLSYCLTGLPPTPEETERFLQDDREDAWECLVDSYLQSPRFGERWARHWMDWVRYADSHGSEGDPPVPHAYQYRDYLIRALNADVSYDVLVREHLAGDLMESPRINPRLGINESAIGPAHLRFVFHGFAPTDALEEKVRFTDDQINVFGKAFQGLTVSCARCHDHKFDAISQADYYALFGIFGSCRPAMLDVNSPARQDALKDELGRLKARIRTALADEWLHQTGSWPPDRLPDLLSGLPEHSSGQMVTGPWQRIQQQMGAGETFQQAWDGLQEDWKQSRQAIARDRELENFKQWRFAGPDRVDPWYSWGNGLNDAGRSAGEFALALEGDNLVEGIYPAGVYTHALSTLHRGVFGSPDFGLDAPYRVFLRVTGGGQPSLRYVVQDYPRDGTVFPISTIQRDGWYWHSFNLDYWEGDDIHLELATSRDGPLKTGSRDRSWFGIREVVVRHQDLPPPATDNGEYLLPLFRELETSPPASLPELAACYRRAVINAVTAWQNGSADDAQALFLDGCLGSGLLDNSFANGRSSGELAAAYRNVESRVPVPTRVPGVVEADAADQALLKRGDHRQPLEAVPRGFLQAIDGQPFVTRHSGRMELATALLDENNPLTARVITNRIWHHLWGEGIVATPDNFGQMGQLPSHPELLDYLAVRLRENRWSLKQSIRFVLLSATWQQACTPTDAARTLDPGNRLMSHAHTRRLDAESIRDTLLFLSGELDETMFGPGFAANSGSKRRSVYVNCYRNSMDEFLLAFDAPVPFSTTGKRNQTNVPAQSLALLNDSDVIGRARVFGQRIARDPDLHTDDQRLQEMFCRAFGRGPDREELEWLRQFLMETSGQIEEQDRNRRSLAARLEDVDARIEAVLAPARTALMSRSETADPADPLTAATAHWVFSGGTRDQPGGLEIRLHGDARMTTEGLAVDGAGYASTGPLGIPLAEKTLEVWVRLATLDQRGGGVMTIQDLQGNVFDSLVYAEQQPNQWLAGSNHFQRTRSFAGAAESRAGRDVHFAITWDSDGTVAGYRNGIPYGSAYRQGPLATYAADGTQILFGMRHGQTATAGRMFAGTIIEARLYDRALTPQEALASFERRPLLSHQAVLQQMPESDRKQLEELEQARAGLQNRFGEIAPPSAPHEVWARMAHAFFNMKELVYLR